MRLSTSASEVRKWWTIEPRYLNSVVTLKNILTNEVIDLKVKGSVYVALCLSILLWGSVTSATDALEPCAALPSLTQFVTVFHLPASSNAFQLSPSTRIIDVVFFNGQAMSPKCH
jgi:hypothetical protein